MLVDVLGDRLGEAVETGQPHGLTGAGEEQRLETLPGAPGASERRLAGAEDRRLGTGEHRVDKLSLAAGKVVVERALDHPEAARQPAHREASRAVGNHLLQGSVQHVVTVQGRHGSPRILIELQNTMFKS